MTGNSDKILSFEDIQEILKKGELGVFVGRRESEALEAKQRKPYDFTKTLGIFELSKDVASFANNKGGFIICGLDTEKHPDSPHDFVKGLKLFPRSDFYKQAQIGGIIRVKVFPRISLTLNWYASKDNKGLGVGAIEIPPQDEAKKYFIVKISGDVSELNRENLGIPIRTDDNTRWLTAQELHKMANLKPTDLQEVYQSLSNQIADLKTSIPPVGTPVIDIDSIPAMVEETINATKQ